MMKLIIKKNQLGTSLVAQWLRIHLPIQGTWVRSLVQKIPHAAEQLSPCTKLLSLRSRAREPQLLSLHTLEPVCYN